jgi:hypothetical protein
MRKSTLFISAALTAFMLAVLVGVASAYQNIVKSAAVTAQPPTAVALVENISAPQAAAPTAVTALTPEQAAALAAQVLGRTDLFSVETADLNGASVYLVTFSAGDLVYVSPEGQILSISKIVPTVVVNTVKARRSNNDEQVSVPVPPGGSDDNGNENNNEHDDDDDHDDGEHEDD